MSSQEEQGAKASGDLESDSITCNDWKEQDIESENEKMKRTAAKQLIERYYYQLIEGCGNDTCKNENCASNHKVGKLEPNQAAAKALQLVASKAVLCESLPAKIAKTTSNGLITGKANPGLQSKCVISSVSPSSSNASLTVENCSENSSKGCVEPKVSHLTEDTVMELVSRCEKNGSPSVLIRVLGQVFSDPLVLCRSFCYSDVSKLVSLLEPRALSKEEIRSLEGEVDKDEDVKDSGVSQCVVEGGDEPRRHPALNEEITVDVEQCRRVFTLLMKSFPHEVLDNVLINALIILSEVVEIELKIHKDNIINKYPNLLNMFVIVMEIPSLANSEYLELALPNLCTAVSLLPLACQVKLVKFWSKYPVERLKHMVANLQTLITAKAITWRFTFPVTRDYRINDEPTITSPTSFLKLLHYASLYGGDLDFGVDSYSESDTMMGSLDDFSLHSYLKEVFTPPKDPLAEALGVEILDCRKPLINHEDFYNEPLNELIEMDKDFAYYRENKSEKFSFMNHAFILTPATKVLGLYYENRVRMYSERRLNLYTSMINSVTPNPYLKVKVRRDHIIDDALIKLEMIAMESPIDLKKQLVVEFEGEQGIDEGGVSKEFFQLVVEDIFNPNYAMFTFNPETQTHWFNPTSFESDAQFTLIGIVLGLAIYNNIILDVHFPMVLYRKLMKRKGTYADLEEFDPSLHRNLKQLLDHPEDDVEEVFMETFRIRYKDVFGTVLTHDLKENGDEIFVTQGNKQEFVDLYADFLLNKSIERQFRSFRRGFQLVTDESSLSLLFRPEEIELLVCGSKDFDFNALEESTEYDGNYHADSPTIRYFWEVVHSLSLDEKRKLLQFTTGSDRVPVGGLSKLKLIIAKNGDDSDRLPTAHTCFNVLLLPEYSTKEKLKDRLLKAIHYSKGFGML